MKAAKSAQQSSLLPHAHLYICAGDFRGTHVLVTLAKATKSHIPLPFMRKDIMNCILTIPNETRSENATVRNILTTAVTPRVPAAGKLERPGSRATHNLLFFW